MPVLSWAALCLCALLCVSVATGQPATLTIVGTTAILNNSLIALTLDLTNAQCLSLYSSHLPHRNLLYNTNGPCEWDREPPEVRPVNLRYSVVRNSSAFVHVHLEDGDVPTLANFRWTFDYALAEGVSGVYVWGTVGHPASAAADTLHQYRWIARINPGDDGEDRVVDTVAVSSVPFTERLLPTVKEAQQGEQLSPNEAEMVTLSNGTRTAEHKYDYSLDSSEHQIHGLYHSQTGLGVWTLSPRMDYHNGAFDAQDLTSYGPTNYTGLYIAHIQMLNGGHFGEGDELVTGEWSKLYGPWLWYINRGNASVSAYEDAWAQFRKEEGKWPYNFITDADYHSRGGLTGTLVVTDTPDPRTGPPSPGGAMIFLTNPTATHGPYWKQCNGYTYWNTTDDKGGFVFTGVRAGEYELHASVPGVIGEKGGVMVKVGTGAVTAVGTVSYAVPRNGSSVWEIGFADRSAAEFRHGDAYRYWGLYDLFPTDFPDSVQYHAKPWRQPASQWRRDWNYAQVPVNGQPSNWTVLFDVDAPVTGPQHPAFLHIAFAGVCSCPLRVVLNGKATATMADLTENDTSIMQDGIHGIYQVRTVMLDSSSLQATGNVLVLTGECSGHFDGLLYDALRFELAGWTPPQLVAGPSVHVS